MKIAKYVGELLFDYECIVIPGLGGFIAEDKPVSINRVTDKFSPSYRKVHFNIHLRANDGLLINHVAQQENVGYKTAKQRVDSFVHLCHKALEEGKRINFKHIGSIYYDEDKNIVFNQDEKINYNADSFGLTDIVSPSIRRETDEEKVKKVVKSAIDSAIKKPKEKPKEDRKPAVEKAPRRKVMQANRRKSSFTNQLIFLTVVFFLMGIGYMYLKRDAMGYYFDRYYTHIPIFYSSVNDYFATNINSTPVAKISRGTASFFPFVLDKDKKENLVVKENNGEHESITFKEDITDDIVGDGTETEIVVIEPTPEDIKKPAYSRALNEDETTVENKEITGITTEPEPVNTTDLNTPVLTTERFFIIGGSFSKEANAKKLVNELKDKGYSALIADTNKYGMFRVAIESFKSRIEAERNLVAIRRDTNPKAWVLEK